MARVHDTPHDPTNGQFTAGGGGAGSGRGGGAKKAPSKTPALDSLNAMIRAHAKANPKPPKPAVSDARAMRLFGERESSSGAVPRTPSPERERGHAATFRALGHKP